MFYLRRIVGESMEPTLKQGRLVIFLKTKKIKTQDIVIAKVGNREVVKRINNINDSGVELIGDNPEKSTDSRSYGAVDMDRIKGKLIIKL